MTLGQLELLKSDQFELSQQILYRDKTPCGVLFCLHGPRALRLSAIWETDQNRILFYGTCGRRMKIASVGATASLRITPSEVTTA